MKIALVDNMNNNFFAFARYLKDLGMDITLYTIPNRHMDHFDIYADTFKSQNELTYVKHFPCSIDNKSWFFFQRKKIYREFKDYDIIISCGLSSAFMERAGIHSHIIIPYGSDLYDIPFRKIKFGLNFYFVRTLFWSHQAHFQKNAYRKAEAFVTDDEYELYGTAVKKLGLSALNVGIPMLYNFEDIDNTQNHELWSFLDNHDFIVFNHARQYWKSNSDNLHDHHLYGGLKRNDKLLKAFAQFVKKTNFKSPLLVLFEYGVDTEETKILLKKLGIESYIKWMPTMHRKHIMYGLKKATFTSNAFRENKTDIGGVCYESLAAGTAHINNCADALKNPKHKFYQSPMIHALHENEIYNIFVDYEQNPDKYERIASESQKWFNEHLGIELAKKYVKVMEKLSMNKQSYNTIRDIFEN